MPFAPIVREEDAGRFFTVSEAVRDCARYMTVTTLCSDEAKAECPAVVHVDGTARPQLVSARSNAFLHRVLSQFASITGTGVLINTSFNIHEEPIVTSAEDALRSFFEAGLDFLVLGDFLISRSENTEAELAYVRERASESAKKLRAARAEVERAAFDRLDDAALLLEKEELLQWIARKKSSTLWKPFSSLANVEWRARNHVQTFVAAWSPPATDAEPPPATGGRRPNGAKKHAKEPIFPWKRGV